MSKTKPGIKPVTYKNKIFPFLDDIMQWRGDGMTEGNIAKELGVSYSSFRRAKKNHFELEQVIKHGTKLLSRDIERSLYQIAKGYEFDVVETVVTRGVVSKVRTMRRMQHPNLGAICATLKKLEPEKWKSLNNKVELSGPEGGPIEIAAVAKESRDDVLRRIDSIASRKRKEISTTANVKKG